MAVLIAVAVIGAGLAHAGHVRSGGTFRVSFNNLDYVDPALAYSPESWALLDTTCARLMTTPDKPTRVGSGVVPEVAAGYPKISADGKTYTFTIRKGFRFSDGTAVHASAFVRAINRTLSPDIQSPGMQYTSDIVGADDVTARRRSQAAGVSTRGNRLVVKLTHPAPDFPARTTTPFFCAVPPTLPIDREGVGAFPAAGPYYVAEYRAGERVVLRRNRFYHGKRPHHVDGFAADLQASSPQEVLDRIEKGDADWGYALPNVFLDPSRRLAEKYGTNRSQFFVKPGLTARSFALNSSRPLFRDNVRLRQAVNFAIDRPALREIVGGRLVSKLTDQYLPPSMPGYRNVTIYPLGGPNVRKAQSLARGSTRSGKATFYVPAIPPAIAQAQVVKRDLANIGLEVEIKTIPPPAYLTRLTAPGEAWDIAIAAWFPDYLDPYAYINSQFDGRSAGVGNLGFFNSPKYNRLMRAAARLQGRARYLAYGKLDIDLARNAAPMVAVSYSNEFTLVSKRVGCVVLRPMLDLTAVCLK